MGQVSPKFRRWEHQGRVGLQYWCQGCGSIHGVVVEGAGAWGFNGSYERPTFTPSVLVTGIQYERGPDGAADHERPRRDAAGEPFKATCHTFVRDGVVEFLGDCSHDLAGQSHPLPDLPPDYCDDGNPPP